MTYCWKCKSKLNVDKINFRAICDICGSDLHSCKGCIYFSLGKPNDCNVPDTFTISDRENSNFCEDFRAIEDIQKKEKKSLEEVSKKLFGEAEQKTKKTFNDLF